MSLGICTGSHEPSLFDNSISTNLCAGSFTFCQNAEILYVKLIEMALTILI